MTAPNTNRPSPIKVLIAKPGLDGHDVGAKLVGRALAEAGMDVSYSGLKRSPEQIAERAQIEGVDVVGLSIMSGAHLPLAKSALEALRARGLAHLPVVVGGVIPEHDREPLLALGVAAVFPVGTPFEELVSGIEKLVSSRKSTRAAP
ncbi:MAG: cobalamin B12-binding domain-containing protein [Deltaproteobacteria bacterium]|nr:cobalamin B12-binding domain-containing protein [Deltaproteobacteria bacterium]